MPRNPLNPRLPPKDKSTGRRKRRRFKKDGSRPQQSDTMRRLWSDPDFLAKMKARSESNREDMKRHPLKYSRAGVPDGMTRKMVKPLWDRAYAFADKLIEIMKENGELPVAIPDSDAAKAEAALREACAMALGPTEQKVKIQAINTVLAYTKSKPEAKSKITLDKAEDFLAEVAKDLKGDS